MSYSEEYCKAHPELNLTAGFSLKEEASKCSLGHIHPIYCDGYQCVGVGKSIGGNLLALFYVSAVESASCGVVLPTPIQDLDYFFG